MICLTRRSPDSHVPQFHDQGRNVDLHVFIFSFLFVTLQSLIDPLRARKVDTYSYRLIVNIVVLQLVMDGGMPMRPRLRRVLIWWNYRCFYKGLPKFENLLFWCPVILPKVAIIIIYPQGWVTVLLKAYRSNPSYGHNFSFFNHIFSKQSEYMMLQDLVSLINKRSCLGSLQFFRYRGIWGFLYGPLVEVLPSFLLTTINWKIFLFTIPLHYTFLVVM